MASALVFQLKNGVDYYLTAGAEVAKKTGDIKLTKSIALSKRNPGGTSHLYIREDAFNVKPESGNILILNICC